MCSKKNAKKAASVAHSCTHNSLLKEERCSQQQRRSPGHPHQAAANQRHRQRNRRTKHRGEQLQPKAGQAVLNQEMWGCKLYDPLGTHRLSTVQKLQQDKVIMKSRESCTPCGHIRKGRHGDSSPTPTSHAHLQGPDKRSAFKQRARGCVDSSPHQGVARHPWPFIVLAPVSPAS